MPFRHLPLHENQIWAVALLRPLPQVFLRNEITGR